MPARKIDPRSRRERRRQQTRDRIVEAAEALFGERGYDATKVSEICDRVDIAYGTFFNHFPEKRDVLRAMAERAVAQITERLEELSKVPASIEDQLMALFEGSADELEADHPARRDLLGRIHAIAYTEAPEERDRRFHSAFEAFFAEGVARGTVRGDVPIETLAEIVGSTFAQLSLSWVHFDDYPVRERARESARFLAGALAPPADA